eukprot:1418433-Amphidinium_carterae.1
MLLGWGWSKSLCLKSLCDPEIPGGGCGWWRDLSLHRRDHSLIATRFDHAGHQSNWGGAKTCLRCMLADTQKRGQLYFCLLLSCAQLMVMEVANKK